MNKVENFAKNLESIRKTRKKSLTEFAREIGIPKSTLQSILKMGTQLLIQHPASQIRCIFLLIT